MKVKIQEERHYNVVMEVEDKTMILNTFKEYGQAKEYVDKLNLLLYTDFIKDLA